MKKTPILALALSVLVAAPALAQSAAGASALPQTGTGTSSAAQVATPTVRSGNLNPEVTPPGMTPQNLNPEVNPVPGVLNPEVAKSKLPGVPAVPNSPTTITITNPNGTIASPPVADPGQIVENPNPQSQASAPAGTLPPGVDSNAVQNGGGVPPANVRSGMHAPALGAPMNGAGQAAPAPATAAPANP